MDPTLVASAEMLQWASLNRLISMREWNADRSVSKRKVVLPLLKTNITFGWPAAG